MQCKVLANPQDEKNVKTASMEKNPLHVDLCLYAIVHKKEGIEMDRLESSQIFYFISE